MTYNEAKYELNACRFLKHDIDSCYDQVRELNNKLLVTSSVISIPDSVNPFTSGTDRIRYQIEEIVNKVLTLWRDLEKAQSALYNRIESVKRSNVLYGEILSRRFIHGDRLEKIAVDLDYSYDHIRRSIGSAIRRYANCFPTCYKAPQSDT